MSYLVTIFFQENAQSTAISFYNSNSLSNESLISIANGLNESVTGITVTLGTNKAKSDAITGDSIEVIDGETTYHRFVEDANGSMTLTEFITTVKGWTLA